MDNSLPSDSRRRMGGRLLPRKPRLTHNQVETLHVIAWVLGIFDVALVAVTFFLS